MGNFRVEIEAVGGHGCQRDVKDGGTVYGCGNLNCPDCRAREFVEDMKRRYDVREAKLIHWPGLPESVVDDLLTKTRKGSF